MDSSLERDGWREEWALLGDVDVRELTTARLVVAHDTVDEREQRVVTPEADVLARVNLGAALTHQDVAGLDLLATELLHSASLAVAVTTVS